MNKRFGIGRYVFFALIAGLIIGEIIRLGISNQEVLVNIAEFLNIISGLFMRLIKMIIAPLVFTTLVVGISKLSDASSLGRLFLKSIIVFIVGTFIAVIIGYTIAEIFKPGVALAGVLNSTTLSSPNIANGINLKSFLNEVVPSAIMDSFAKTKLSISWFFQYS